MRCPVGVFMLTPEGSISEWNRCMEHWTRLVRSAVIGSDLDDVFPGALDQKHMARICVVFDGGPPAIFSSDLHGSLFPLTLRNGSPRLHHTTVSGIEKDGRYHALFVLQDVTSLSDQVHELREAKRLRVRVEQSQRLESLGLLAGGIAHDFHNILAALLISADLALHEVGDDCEAAIHLNEVLAAGRQGAGLAKQMLAYSGKATLVEENVDINVLVRDTTEPLRASVSKHIEILFELSPDALWTNARVTQIRQVVMNLVVNAAEAIGEKPGTIVARSAWVPGEEAQSDPGLVGKIGSASDFVLIEVTDTGPGLAPEAVERLLEPFYTTKAKGRGLGLAAVRGIVERHGGGLALASWPGRGTRFRIYLPRVEREVVPDAVATEEIPDDIRGSGTVLIVDDEDNVRRSTGRAIARFGFEILHASDGAEGLRTFEAHKDDIVAVVMDYVMPGGNGIDALADLRRLAPGLPALLVSGYSELDGAELKLTGPTDILPKPYEMDVLRNKLFGVLTSESVQPSVV